MKKWVPAATLAVGIILLLIPEEEEIRVYDCRYIDYIENAPQEVINECRKATYKNQRKVITI